MKRCAICHDSFLSEEISEWRSEHEQFSMHPFICPDCYDRLQRKDPQEQIEEIIDLPFC